MKVTVRIPSDERVTWGERAAQTAVGKPILDRPVGGTKVGTVARAYVRDGDLYLEAEVAASVEFDLAAEEVTCVSFFRTPAYSVDDLSS